MIQEELHSPERASQIEIIIHDGIITSSRVIFTTVSEGETGPNEEDNTLCEIVCYNRIPYVVYIYIYIYILLFIISLICEYLIV